MVDVDYEKRAMLCTDTKSGTVPDMSRKCDVVKLWVQLWMQWIQNENIVIMARTDGISIEGTKQVMRATYISQSFPKSKYMRLT